MIKLVILMSTLLAAPVAIPHPTKQSGVASYYGKQFHGKRTASGSIYNQWAMTAAHKSLPFGTKVRVTNLNNNKSVVLKITDRGPYVGGRIIDISRKANQQLSCNLCKVSMSILSLGDGKYRRL